MQEEVIHLAPHQKIYFASDFHLGAPNRQAGLKRERRVVAWLDQIKKDAHTLCLLGDIFDFWYEYKRAIPKGFIRIQGKLAELSDKGIHIYFLTGNHDMWMFDYFQQEIGIKVYHAPIEIKIGEQTLIMGHGDGLGPRERGYKILKKIYTNKICQWLFTQLHPDLGIGLAHRWSNSRWRTDKKVKKFIDKERESLFAYCRDMESNKHRDFYIFGHRHLPLDMPVNKHSRYINLGDWMSHDTYAVYDGVDIKLVKFNREAIDEHDA